MRNYSNHGGLLVGHFMIYKVVGANPVRASMLYLGKDSTPSCFALLNPYVCEKLLVYKLAVISVNVGSKYPTDSRITKLPKYSDPIKNDTIEILRFIHFFFIVAPILQ